MYTLYIVIYKLWPVYLLIVNVTASRPPTDAPDKNRKHMNVKRSPTKDTAMLGTMCKARLIRRPFLRPNL